MSKTQSQLSSVRKIDSVENKVSQPQSQISTSVAKTGSVTRHVSEFRVPVEQEVETASVKPEPNVSSLDPEERKQARRLRIARRNEAIRKAAQIAEGVQVEEGGTLKTRLESQVENSAKELERLLLEGRELVTNVRVANDSREVSRRLDEAEKHESRTKRLEEDAKITKEMYEEVEKKWKELSSSSDPMDLKAEIDAQKEKCDILLARKDEVIKQLITEVDQADVRFVRDQLKQKRDIAILVDRIENHVKLMKESYRNELELIEDAIAAEKKELIETSTESWEKLYQERERQENENLEKRFNDIEDQENEVQNLRSEHREKYRSTKIQLETDLQTMQKEMENIKFQCFLNSEKLDYNYQILQRREQENIVIRAQQKRRLNKLQDSLTNLRRRIRLGKEAASTEAVRLNDEVVKLHDNILATERKADYFANINDRKYHRVWDMNEETARELLDRIYAIDKIIHEQQLGYEWEQPDTSIPCKTDLPSFRSAQKAVSEMFNDPEEDSDEVEPGKIVEKLLKREREADQVQGKLLRQRLVKHILQQVADNSGFLIEDRLNKLLEPYSKCQKTIVRLDNVFDALGLRFETDIELLREYFIPYALCTECPPPDARELDDSVSDSGPFFECPTEHREPAAEPCEERSDLEEIPPPKLKLSFDSEEISGALPLSKDVVIKPADEEEVDKSELIAFPETFMEESGLQDYSLPGQGPGPSTSKAADQTLSTSGKDASTTGKASSTAAKGSSTAETEASLRTDRTIQTGSLMTESAARPGEGSLSQKTDLASRGRTSHKSDTSSRKADSYPTRKTDPIAYYCRARSAPPRSLSALPKTSSVQSRTKSAPPKRESSQPRSGSSTPRKGAVESQAGASRSRSTSPGPGSSKTRPTSPKPGSTAAQKKSSRSKTRSTERESSHEDADVSETGGPPQIVVSEFSQFGPSEPQMQASCEGTVIDFTATVTIDFDDGGGSPSKYYAGLSAKEPAVPMLPKCPVPPVKECIESHELEIQPIYVYMALNDFVSKFRDNELSDIKSIARILSRKRNTVSRMLSPDDVASFWESYRNSFPEERRKLWEGFQKGLNKYYQVLSERHKLNMETMALKRQNEELRQLLANYIEYNEKMKHKHGTTLPPLNLR